ncbi:MAG: hypothetical protein ACYDBJ_25340 [Aggregatilineales bacterium]
MPKPNLKAIHGRIHPRGWRRLLALNQLGSQVLTTCQIVGFAGEDWFAQLMTRLADTVRTECHRKVFTVVGIAKVRGERLIETGLMARSEGPTIVIEYDQNNKPLVDALVQAGVPRKQIILSRSRFVHHE